MDKLTRRIRRKRSIRKKVFGTSAKPRLCVHKSNRCLYAQIIDDMEGKTLCSSVSRSSAESTGGKTAYTFKNMKFAEALGSAIAENAAERGIKKVVFDRSGYRYHGVIKAMADAARAKGLQF